MEQRSDPIFSFHSVTANDLFDNFFKTHSSLSKIKRILAYCLRFINKCKNNNKDQTSTNDSHLLLIFPEIKSAKERIICCIQKSNFSEDLKWIKNQKTLSKHSQLRSLHPFIDENSLLRVGGHLQNSQLSFNQNHLIL